MTIKLHTWSEACMNVCMYERQGEWKSLSCVQFFATPWTVTRQAPLFMEFSRQEYLEWAATFSSRWIFPTQGSNPGLLHCWQILCHLSHQGNPWKTPVKEQAVMSCNCVPPTPYTDVLTPSTSEGDYIWRLGLEEGIKTKWGHLGES